MNPIDGVARQRDVNQVPRLAGRDHLGNLSGARTGGNCDLGYGRQVGLLPRISEQWQIPSKPRRFHGAQDL